MINPDSINKGDRVVERVQNWIYYQKGHEYNEMHESILGEGTVIAKSQYGVLVKWDPRDRWHKPQEWINFKKFNIQNGFAFYGMKSNSYTIYEKL